MILANMQDAERYYSLHPLLKELFEYVRTHDLSQVPAGRVTLKGDELFINVTDATLLPRDERKMEVHRAYMDVHIPLSCAEEFGWRHTDSLPASDAPFDEAADCALYSQPATEYFTLRPGQFCIVYPEDAHAPMIGQGTERKLIVKVRL